MSSSCRALALLDRCASLGIHRCRCGSHAGPKLPARRHQQGLAYLPDISQPLADLSVNDVMCGESLLVARQTVGKTKIQVQEMAIAALMLLHMNILAPQLLPFLGGAEALTFHNSNNHMSESRCIDKDEPPCHGIQEVSPTGSGTSYRASVSIAFMNSSSVNASNLAASR